MNKREAVLQETMPEPTNERIVGYEEDLVEAPRLRQTKQDILREVS